MNLLQQPDKGLRLLRSRNNILPLENKCRHSMHILVQPVLLLSTNLTRIALIRQNEACLGAIQTRPCGHCGQHTRDVDIFPARKKRFKQRQLQFCLTTLLAGPVQQLVRAKGIDHAHAVEVIKGKTERFAQR